MNGQNCEDLFHKEFQTIVENRLPPVATDEEVLSLSEVDQTVFWIWYFNTEVLNGGIVQWAGNPTGGFCKETLAAFERVGAESVVQIIRSALEVMGIKQLPKDYDDRYALVLALNEKQREQLENMDGPYERQMGGMFAKVMHYLEKNRRANSG